MVRPIPRYGDEALDALAAMVRDFGLKEVRPHIRSLEQAGEFPRELYRRMGDLGLFSACFPGDGDAGGGYRALAVVAEQLAYVYPPLSAPMNLQAATVPLTIAHWGSTAQVQDNVSGLISGQTLGCNAMTEPDGGSDLLGAMRTRAERDGDDYLITGSKMWITNANVADIAVVYAKTDAAAGHKGVSAFLVPMESAGVVVDRVPCRVLGSLMPTNMITFDRVRVPASALLGDEGDGFKVAMSAMDFGRLTVAARSLGLAQACLDAAVDYATSREAFGQQIGQFQMVKKQIADMTCEVAAARRLVWEAAVRYDEGTIPTRESSIAKYYSAEVCNRAAQACAEIHGGYAFSDELPVSIYLNYAKLWQTGEGSANIQAVLIADDALGYKRMDRHERPSFVPTEAVSA